MVQIISQSGGRLIMKDHKDKSTVAETKSYFEKIESADPKTISNSLIAKIMEEMKKLKKS